MDNATWVMEEAKLIVGSVITVVFAGFGIVIQRGMKRIAEQQAQTAEAAKKVAAAKLNFDLF